MRDKTPPTPLANLSDTDLQVLTRLIRRYARAVGNYASLASAMHRASRACDASAFRAAKQQMATVAGECRDCQTAIRILQEELSQNEWKLHALRAESEANAAPGPLAMLSGELYSRPNIGAPLTVPIEVLEADFPEEVSSKS